jgi:hypothetical protein
MNEFREGPQLGVFAWGAACGVVYLALGIAWWLI